MIEPESARTLWRCACCGDARECEVDRLCTACAEAMAELQEARDQTEQEHGPPH